MAKPMMVTAATVRMKVMTVAGVRNRSVAGSAQTSSVSGSTRSARGGAQRTCPSPVTTYLLDVISGSPSGPRACSFWVEMPISAPNPNSPPSVKRVEALTMTAAASTSATKRRAAACDPVTIASVWPEECRRMCVDRGVEVGDDGRGDLQAEVLGVPVRRPWPVRRPSNAANAASPWTVTPAPCRAATTRGTNAVGHGLVHEQRLGGVADRGALGLGVHHDGQRHVEVGVRVDVHVAVADAGLDHRHRRLLDHRADQAGSPARDQHVDQAAGAHQRLDRLVALAGDQRDAVGRQPGSGNGLAEHLDDQRCSSAARSTSRAAARRCRS